MKALRPYLLGTLLLAALSGAVAVAQAQKPADKAEAAAQEREIFARLKQAQKDEGGMATGRVRK